MENELEKVGLVESPKPEITFLFAPHATGEDLTKFKELLPKNDVIVIEAVGWTDDIEDYFNKISKGVDVERPKKFKSFFNEFNEYVVGSNKKIIFIDLNKDSLLYNDLIKSFVDFEKKFYDLLEIFLNGNLSIEMVNEFKVVVDNFIVKNYVDRENYIIENLKKRLEMVSSEYKEGFKVLVVYGASHDTLFHKMKKDLHFGNLSRLYNYGVNVKDPLYLISFNLHNKIENDISYYAKFILVYLIKSITTLKLNEAQLNWIIKSMLDRLNINDILQLSNDLKKCQDGNNVKLFKSLLLTRFRIVFPDSEENIQSIIGKSNWERFKKLSEKTI